MSILLFIYIIKSIYQSMNTKISLIIEKKLFIYNY